LEFITEILDFFLPRFCPSCRIKLLCGEKFICLSCLNKIKKIDKSRLEFEFNKKFLNQKIISGFTSLYLFEKDKELQHLIHSLKYNGKFLTGSFLGELLGKKIKDELTAWNIHLILPIPLHQLKKAERGYNQSFYISKGLSKEINIPVVSGIIKRRKYTQSQTKMNILERQKNIEKAFKIKNKKKIIGKNILLVDDVITTGATISECGKVLLDTGASQIYAASVAIAD
jgi:competence protein ComFC